MGMTNGDEVSLNLEAIEKAHALENSTGAWSNWHQMNKERAFLLAEVKKLHEALRAIATDLPLRGPNGFEDFSSAYSRVKNIAKADLAEPKDNGGEK